MGLAQDRQTKQGNRREPRNRLMLMHKWPFDNVTYDQHRLLGEKRHSISGIRKIGDKGN